MGTPSAVPGCLTRESSRSPRAALAALICLAGLAGCNTSEPVESASPDSLDQRVQELSDDNGLSYNGLSYNGLSYNGLSYNGLSYNGLSSANFSTWFQGNPALADQVMLYIVRCAMPAGQTLTYTDPQSNQTYTWAGGLGLAPSWSSGTPPTVQEQQVITACLLAHTNKYRQHVTISVQGRDANSKEIPTSSTELTDFSRREACFFGNLFNGEGTYVGLDRGDFSTRESTSRACALMPSAGSSTSNCPPMVHIGSCASACTLDGSLTYYKTCTKNGTTYLPLTIRLRPQDVFTCGDGTCQISESCGTGYQYYSCGADCGACP
ncbi:MAG: hypothetical protein ACJ8AT_37020 [Hyalangium sp.]|uniref:hypothetical protein n=1 Tax=Hyalangium sp. TaxID=2028555 RepID=UPI00389A9C61